MNFKRILAVLLSALMLTSMASFTVSAQDTELVLDPILAYTTAIKQGKLTNNERAYTSIGYDADNDIVYTHVVPAFDKKTGSDNSMYINMFGLDPAITANKSNLYFVCYMRSNLSTTNAYAGFYGGLHNKYTGGNNLTYDGSEEWVKQIYTLAINDDAIGSSSTHAWIRPIGANKVHNTTVTGKDENGKDIVEITGNAMAEDAYYDVAGIAIFDDLASAEAYDIPALSSGMITISFYAYGETVDSYDVAAGKYVASNVVFPTSEPVAPEGMAFAGWSTEDTGTPF